MYFPFRGRNKGFTETQTKRAGGPVRLPAQLAGWWGQLNWNSVRWGKIVLERLEEPGRTNISCTGMKSPTNPTKEEPLSFVLFESPCTSVSKVCRGHPTLVSLGFTQSSLQKQLRTSYLRPRWRLPRQAYQLASSLRYCPFRCLAECCHEKVTGKGLDILGFFYEMVFAFDICLKCCFKLPIKIQC